MNVDGKVQIETREPVQGQVLSEVPEDPSLEDQELLGHDCYQFSVVRNLC